MQTKKERGSATDVVDIQALAQVSKDRKTSSLEVLYSHFMLPQTGKSEGESIRTADLLVLTG